MKQILLFLLALLCPLTAHAQGGCVNSPENPTVVLALIGASSATFAAWRRHLRR